MDFFEKGKISKSAKISRKAKLGKNVTVGQGSIIYDNVHLGDDSFVGPYCVLGEPVADYYQIDSYKNPPLIIGENSLIRSHSIFYSGSEIGAGLRTGHHVVIREKCEIGINCLLGSWTNLEGYLKIGNYVRLHAFVSLGQQSVIKDFVWMYTYSGLTNDPHPPSETCIHGPTIESYAIICAQAVLLPGVIIGEGSLVGANALVTKDVPREAVVAGIPAKVVGSVRDIKCKDGKLKQPYPWRDHFSRGMPWEKQCK